MGPRARAGGDGARDPPDRPLVVVSRWQGGTRDGHGQHQAAGLLTREACAGRGRPRPRSRSRSPRACGPGQPLKLYTGGWREDEPWSARIETGEYSPWLGDSYANFGRLGLSFQRSQNAGRLNLAPGPAPLFFARLASRLPGPAQESSFFDGIPTRLAAVFSLFGRPAPPGHRARAGRHGAPCRVGDRGVHGARSLRLACPRSPGAFRHARGDPAGGGRARRAVPAAGEGAPVRGRHPRPRSASSSRRSRSRGTWPSRAARSPRSRRHRRWGRWCRGSPSRSWRGWPTAATSEITPTGAGARARGRAGGWRQPTPMTGTPLGPTATVDAPVHGDAGRRTRR